MEVQCSGKMCSESYVAHAKKKQHTSKKAKKLWAAMPLRVGCFGTQ
jgi:hypothetical protein